MSTTRRIKCAVALSAFLGSASAVVNPEEYVNTLIGTDNSYEFSRGNSLPITAVPRGFNHWGPTTHRYATEDPGTGWWFNPREPKFQGMKLTHQPSPWINDWAYLVWTSHIGEGSFSESYWESDEATTSPYHFKTTLGTFENDLGNSTAELTPSNYGAIMRWDFPPYDPNANFNQRRRVEMLTMDQHADDEYSAFPPPDSELQQFTNLTLITSSGHVEGVTHTMGWGDPNNKVAQNGWGFYFTMTIDPPPQDYDVLIQFWPNWGNREDANLKNREFLRLFYEEDSGVDRVTIKIATSHISIEQARTNFARDNLENHSFESLRLEAKDKWRAALNRIEVVDTGRDDWERSESVLKIFYSNLYRAQLFPRDVTEYTDAGDPVHYPFFMVENNSNNLTSVPGVLYTDIGSWDAYHTMYPILQLAYPSVSVRIMNSWINAYEEGGWVPQWSSPSYKASMVGTMSDVAAADAIVGGLETRFGGFNASKLFEASANNAFNTNRPFGEVGRDGIDYYQSLGYVPSNNPEHDPLDPENTPGPEFHESVSRSLDYYQADWALLQAAEFLGRSQSEIDQLRTYSSKHLSLFDEETQFFRTKFDNGTWSDGGLDPYLWKGGYTEGNAWIYRFFSPQDPEALAEMYGGPAAMCRKIKEMTDMNVIVHTGSNQEMYHELSEMYKARIGEYGHSNQPSHYILYLMSALAGSNADDLEVQQTCGQEMQEIIRRVMIQYYDELNYLGDEDNGELSAWYVLSAMGIYDLSPGSGNFQLGTPFFKHVRLHLEDDTNWTDESWRNPPTNGYVDFLAPGNSGELAQSKISRFTLNGEAVTNWRLTFEQLRQGGTVQYEHLTPWSSPSSAGPRSVGALAAIGTIVALFQALY